MDFVNQDQSLKNLCDIQFITIIKILKEYEILLNMEIETI